MPVLDASSAIEIVVDRGAREQVLSALNDDPADAPEIVHLETLQTLRGLVRGGTVPLAEAPGAFRRLTVLPWRSHDHMPLCSRVWELRDR
jgi:predicted nucleic acid-binding protein